MLYVYFGRLEDGAYYLIQGQWIKRVWYLGKHAKTAIRNVCRIIDALRDRMLLRSLPRTLQQYLKQHGEELLNRFRRGDPSSNKTGFTTHSKTTTPRELKQKLLKALDTFDRVLLLLEKMPITCIEKALSKMRAKERARISETLLDDAYEAKAIIEEVVTFLEKIEHEERLS